MRASGPLQVSPLNASGSGQVEIRPRCGLMPTSPVQAAGMRTEPAPSDPSAAGTSPAATAAAEPPLDPPGVWSRFHGLRVCPNAGPSVNGHCPSSDVLVLPTITAPGGAQPPHRLAVLRRRLELPGAAEQRRLARDVHVVLDRDRHAEQRRALTGGPAGVGLRRLRERRLGAHHPERAQVLGRRDPRQRVLHQLDRRCLARVQGGEGGASSLMGRPPPAGSARSGRAA